jgi:hypothetical protein
VKDDKQQRAKCGETAFGADTLAIAHEVADRFPSSVLVEGEVREVYGRTMRALMGMLGEVRAPEEVVPGLAAVGRVALLAAREKMGKSTFAAAAAVEVSRGGSILGQPVQEGVVLWVGLEEAVQDALLRFKEMGANPDNLVLLERLDGPGGATQLKVEIVAHKARFVVIDSLAKFSAGLVEDENSSSGWTRELGHISDIARCTGAAIVILHHANRSTGSYRGSSAIGANVDMIVEMFEDAKDSTVRLLKPKGRWRTTPYAVRYDPDTSTYEPVVLADGSEASARARDDGRQAQILSWLAQHPGSGKAKIREGIGGRAEHVDDALRALVAAGKVTHLGLKEGYVVTPDLASSEANGSIAAT